jgi:uncharacterized protein YecE (DUF72 family)
VTPAQRLARYCEEFDTVELNASFYRWPRDATFQGWYDRLPVGFTMSVKASRGLTHARRLRSPEQWVERITRAWDVMHDKRGAVLVQLHPNQERDDARLDYFLGLLPSWMKVAVEFRHPSWVDDRVFSLLEDHRAAYCVTSGAHLPCVLRATTSWVYVRFHGPDREHLYAGSYSDADLDWWSSRIREWREASLDVYAYFNNDGHGHAVRNAEALGARVR